MQATKLPANADTFDYVIIGAGAAGCVLAARLSEDPSVSVCVLEAGPSDRHPMIHVPAGFIKMIFNENYTWQFRTEPTENTGGRAIATLQGRVVGGSSSLNGLVYNRGQAADYDAWAQAGNSGWSYADVLPYFMRSERRIGGEDEFRGRDGGAPISNIDWKHPICEAFIRGAVGTGIPRNEDYNGRTQEGVGYFQRIIHRGRRVSSARAFLIPALKRKNLTLRTNIRASRILFEGRRAVGVAALRQQGGPENMFHARREVIVCAGPINTPRLLQISGVGPQEVLADLGIAPVHILPGVGRNLRDHFSVRVVARAKNTLTINERAKGLRLAGEIARWLVGKPSILALSPSLVHVFWKSDAALEQPDLQGVFTPASYKQGFVSLLDDFPGMTCGFWQHRPASTGFVRARSTDPFVDPIIQPNYLSADDDKRVLIAGIRLARKLLTTPELAPYFDHEVSPGPDVTTDEALLEYARQIGTSSWHLIGTAKMGPAGDSGAVVNSDLFVHGLQSLRVIDSSIMPTSPSANTYAASLMIGEKGADLVRGRTGVLGSATSPAA
ncbi:GMC family oxidoreductase N-terminal domain-containing protein [uncultured Paracoccus sp.]|uniref:GMC family oxidoreductase n=1 Tax=uncultured Paracoccus sp. TaxID=189685 RepID=UPI002617B183|nr:GMC family oxidoreductase N-terminal domain-containing protein [uncultured Paracoccus sp.]